MKIFVTWSAVITSSKFILKSPAIITSDLDFSNDDKIICELQDQGLDVIIFQHWQDPCSHIKILLLEIFFAGNLLIFVSKKQFCKIVNVKFMGYFSKCPFSEKKNWGVFFLHFDTLCLVSHFLRQP